MKIPDMAAGAMVTIIHADKGDGKFWLDFLLDGQPYGSLDFNSAGERQRAYDDLLQMMRQQGAIDLPDLMQ